jgi:hypothetical protein
MRIGFKEDGTLRTIRAAGGWVAMAAGRESVSSAITGPSLRDEIAADQILKDMAEGVMIDLAGRLLGWVPRAGGLA